MTGYRFASASSLLATLLLVSCAERPAPVPAEAEALGSLVRTHLERTRATAAEDPSADSYAELGLAYMANGLPAAARQAFARAAALDTEDRLPLLYEGRAAMASGDLVGAERTLQKLIARWPDFAAGHDYLGYALLEQGKYDEAQAAFRVVIERSPEHPAGHFGLAETQLEAGATHDALATLEEMPEGARQLEYSHYLLERATAATPEGGKAERSRLQERSAPVERLYIQDAWLAGLRAHRRNLDQLMRASRQFSLSGKHDAAIRILDEITTAYPENTEASLARGVALLEAGKLNDANLQMEEIVRENPDRFEAHLTLARILMQSGDLPKAILAAQQAVKIAPDDASTHRSLGRAHVLARQYRKALTAFSDAARVEPDNPVVFVDLAKAALRADELAQATRACQRIIELAPLSIAGPLCLGEAQRRDGKLGAARSSLETARAMQSDHPDVAALETRIGEDS